MPGWLKRVRGMLGMGLTFSAGVGAIASAIAGLVWLLPGGPALSEMVIPVVGSALWAFPIGVVFSGGMALTARGRSFDKLSIPRFALLGAGAGLLLFGALALNAWDAWTARTAIANAAILVGLGSGSATASLLVARRAKPALESGEEPLGLESGSGHAIVDRGPG